MKTWHIAALVIVGLIVAYIAYAMYEKKYGPLVVARKRKADSALLHTEGTSEKKSDIPGWGNKKEPETNSIGTQVSNPWQIEIATEREIKRREREEREIPDFDFDIDYF
jgi:hypothetical protein